MRVLFFTFPIFFYAAGLCAEEAPVQQKTFDYNLDVSMTDIDKLVNPNVGSSIRPYSLAPTAALTDSPGKPRTLGLSKFRVGLDWAVSRTASLDVVLRPDALLQTNDDPNTPPTEFDSRAGTTYVGPSRIFFLDAYSINAYAGPSFSVSAGVWEELAKRRMSYKPLLEFGLFVKLPEKFLGAKFSWNDYKDASDTAQQTSKSGNFADFFVFEGDADRGEIRRYSDQTFDTAPTAENPYSGLSFYYGRTSSDINEMGILIGMCDSKFTSNTPNDEGTGSSTAEYVGTRDEIFYQFIDVFKLKFKNFPTKLSMDIRFDQEQFKGSELQVAGRFHESGSFSASTEISERQWAVAGYHLGTSKYTNDEVVSGYQMDLGYIFKMSPELDLSFMASSEYRIMTTGNGGDSGAFVDENGNARSTLMRFALEIRYLVGA